MTGCRPVCRALAVAVALVALPLAAVAQDDGPRVYQLAPTGAQVFTAFEVTKRGNEGPEPGEVVSGAQTKNDILVLRYARTFGWLGRQLTPFAILPAGRVQVTQGQTSHTSSGLGDVQVGATLGLLGAPALDREAYAAFRPAASVSLLARLYFPTGAYSDATPVSLGANRFAGQLGLPTTLMFGQPYGDANLTALEVLPTLTFYGVNDDPFGAGRRTQAALFSLESHLTHNFSRRIWLSADLLYRNGGATRTDGVDDGNPTRGWSAGASLAVPFVRTTSLILSWQHVVERSDNGPEGWFFRTALVAPF